MSAKQTISVVIDSVSIVRANQDAVSFSVAKTGQCGRDLDYSVLHGDYEKYNERDLRISTPVGNGPTVARLLGWMGPIEIIDATGVRAHKHVCACESEERPGLLPKE